MARIDSTLQQVKEQGASDLHVTTGAPPDQLGLMSVSPMAELRRGLVLVAGPPGTGKSTTLAALVDHISEEAALHLSSRDLLPVGERAAAFAPRGEG